MVCFFRIQCDPPLFRSTDPVDGSVFSKSMRVLFGEGNSQSLFFHDCPKSLPHSRQDEALKNLVETGSSTVTTGSVSFQFSYGSGWSSRSRDTSSPTLGALSHHCHHSSEE